MATTESTEWTKDPDGCVLKTVVRKDFDDFDANSGVRAWRKTHTDAQTTIVEESFDSGLSEDGWEIEGTMTQEPLETHPKFSGASATELANYRIYINDPNSSKLDPQGWKPETSSDTKIQKLWEYRKIGTTDYLQPRTMAKLTRVESAPADQGGLGYITSSIGITVPSPPPNWLLISASGRKEGDKYRNTYQFMGSGPDGWESYIYTPGA